MKSIVTSLGVVVFVAAIVAGGTGAFFSDTETSTDNIFTAGALDLKVDSVAHINGLVCFDGVWHPEELVVWDSATSSNRLADGVDAGDVASSVAAYNVANPANVPQAGEACAGTWDLTDLDNQEFSYTFFDYGDLKPGDSGENTISLHVYNNDAYMCATVDNVADLDNTQTEPEADVDANGTTTGELDSELNFFIWEDDGDNILEAEENILVDGANGEGIEGVYDLYTSLTGPLTGSSTAYLGVYWCYGDVTLVGTTLSCSGESVTNVSQTDSLKADITFYIEQARHNEEFTCQTPATTTPTATVTVDKVVTFTSDLIEGVDVTDFALTIDGPGAPIAVVDQVATSGLPVGTYTITELYSGVPAGITFNASFSGGCTEVGDTGVGTMEVVGGVNPTCVITNAVSPATSTQP